MINQISIAMTSKKKKQQTITVQRPSTAEIRKAIEDARHIVDSIGYDKMKFDGKYYTIKISRRIQCKVMYNIQNRVVVIVMPDGTQFRLDGDYSQTITMLRKHGVTSEELADTKDMLSHTRSVLDSIWKMHIGHTDAATNLARDNVRLLNAVMELQDHIRELQSGFNTALSYSKKAADDSAREIKEAKKAKKNAEKEKDKANADLKKTNEELTRTKKRNSRLAAENNKIKTKRKKKYKKPVAGDKGGARSSRVAPDITKHETADQCTCHVCDTKLGGITREQPRIIEDVVNSRWEVTQYMVTRRWCPHCKKLITTPVPNALHKQRFGNRALAMMSFLKMIGVSFGKIQMIFLAFYNIHLSRDAILNAVRTVSNNLQNEYELIQKEILKGKSVHGDETTWRVMGMLWWVWCVVGKDAVWFNIQEGRGIDEVKKMLPNYKGIVGSDSLPAWNHVGAEHQKCHLHYIRDLDKTKKENDSKEFQTFAKKLRRILDESHMSKKGYDQNDNGKTRQKKHRNLLRRLWYLMDKDYTDADCTRYIKRLYREFYHLFCFVIHGVDWHNNAAERAIRCFVLLRKVMYGNRSEFDHETYATLLSIIGTCMMRDVNPLEYIVTSLSKPAGSPATLPPTQT